MRRMYFLCLTAIFVAVAWTANAQEPVQIDFSDDDYKSHTAKVDGWKYVVATEIISIEEPGDYEISGDAYPAGIEVLAGAAGSTITLNGATLTAKSGNALIVKANNVMLTLTGTNTLSTGINVAAAGSLTIDEDGGGTLTLTTGNIVAAGTLTVAGGEIEVSAGYLYANTGTVNITGGEIELTGPGHLNVGGTGTLTVEGGEITAAGNLTGTGEASVTGGVISVARVNNANAVIDGDVVLTVTTVTMDGDVQKGIVFVNNAGTVHGAVALQADLVLTSSQTLTVPAGSTLDLNGHGLTKNGGTIIIEENDAIIGGFITDFALEGSIEIVGELRYGETVSALLKLKTNVEGQTVDLTQFDYAWENAEGNPADEATYTIVGDDVGSANFGLTVTASASGIYNGITTSGATLTVTNQTVLPKLVTITSLAIPASKEYDQTQDIVGTVEIESDVDAALETDGVEIVFAGEFESQDAGEDIAISESGNPGNPAKLSLDGTNNGWYEIEAQSVTDAVTGLTANITPKLVKVTKDDFDPITKPYDGKTDAATLVVVATDPLTDTDNDIISGDAVTLSLTGAEFSAVYNSKNVATATKVTVNGLELGGNEGGNYYIDYAVDIDAEITPIQLTSIIIHDTVRYYKYPDPKFRVDCDGLITGETVASALKLYTNADVNSGIEGSYFIAVDFTGANYTAPASGVDYVRGALTIEAAPDEIVFSWPTSLSGPIQLPVETEGGVSIVYTIFPSDAATLTDGGLLIPLGGEFRLTATINSNKNYKAFVVGPMVINVSSPSQPPIMREIYLPRVPGVVTDPIAGLHYVTSGTDFTLELSPAEGREFEEVPVVRASRPNDPDVIVLDAVVTPNGDGTYTARIPGVIQNLDVIIEAPVTPATGTAAITGNRIWSAGRRLYIQAVAPGEAQVYAQSGALVKAIPYAAGETVTELPAGIYFIKANGKAQKVLVND